MSLYVIKVYELSCHFALWHWVVSKVLFLNFGLKGLQGGNGFGGRRGDAFDALFV